jgi:hypothetical protein
MIKPWFHNWEKTCCCIHQTFSWGFQLAGHLHYQLHASKIQIFWYHYRGLKKKNHLHQDRAISYPGHAIIQRALPWSSKGRDSIKLLVVHDLFWSVQEVISIFHSSAHITTSCKLGCEQRWAYLHRVGTLTRGTCDLSLIQLKKYDRPNPHLLSLPCHSRWAHGN